MITKISLPIILIIAVLGILFIDPVILGILGALSMGYLFYVIYKLEFKDTDFKFDEDDY